jgi:hypothetical protein
VGALIRRRPNSQRHQWEAMGSASGSQRQSY